MRSDTRGGDVLVFGIRVADEAYLAWTAARIEAHEALLAWFAADASGDRALAHCAYRAALDREDAAARDLERLSVLPAAA